MMKRILFLILIPSILFSQTKWIRNVRSLPYAWVNQTYEDAVPSDVFTDVDSCSIKFRKADDGNWEIYILDEDGNTHFCVDSAGNVGLRTASPTGMLHLNEVGDYAANPTLAFGDGADGLYSNLDGQLVITLNGSWKYQIDGSRIRSRATGGFAIIYANSTVSATAHSFTGDYDTGLHSPAADQVSLVAGGVEILRATQNDAAPDVILMTGKADIDVAAIGDDGWGLSSVSHLAANGKSDGIAAYFEGHIDNGVTTDGVTYGVGAWLNVDAGATTGADVRALDIGIYEAGADVSGGNAYGLAIHMEFDDTNPPTAIYPFRINCNDTPNHATPDALIFAPNRSAIGLVDAAPGAADAYLKIKLQDGSTYRIMLVKE